MNAQAHQREMEKLVQMVRVSRHHQAVQRREPGSTMKMNHRTAQNVVSCFVHQKVGKANACCQMSCCIACSLSLSSILSHAVNQNVLSSTKQGNRKGKAWWGSASR